MNLKGKIDGVEVELNRPLPTQYQDQWYEAVAYRPCKRDEYIFRSTSRDMIQVYWDSSEDSVWIMSLIPRATPEQLKALGKVTGDRPVECKAGDCIWLEDGCLSALSQEDDPQIIGKPRWGLEDAPVEKGKMSTTTDNELNKSCVDCVDDAKCVISRSVCIKYGYFRRKPPAPQDKGASEWTCSKCGSKWGPAIKVCQDCDQPRTQDKGSVHTSCEGCMKEEDGSDACIDCGDYGASVRKNYTAPQPAPEPMREGAWVSVRCSACVHPCTLEAGATLGFFGPISCPFQVKKADFKVIEKRPTPAFTAEQIDAWIMQQLKTFHTLDWNLCAKTLAKRLNDPQDGIEAVTRKDAT